MITIEEAPYYITKEQFENLQHFTRMFEMTAETVKKLCETERSDIEYGFELGQVYNWNRDWFIEMQELTFEIKGQSTNLK